MPDTIEPVGDMLEVSDRLMFHALVMCGFAPSKTFHDSNGQLVFAFDLGTDDRELQNTVAKVLSGDTDDIKVSLTDWMRADATWQMNLRYSTAVKKRNR